MSKTEPRDGCRVPSLLLDGCPGRSPKDPRTNKVTVWSSGTYRNPFSGASGTRRRQTSRQFTRPKRTGHVGLDKLILVFPVTLRVSFQFFSDGLQQDH